MFERSSTFFEEKKHPDTTKTPDPDPGSTTLGNMTFLNIIAAPYIYFEKYKAWQKTEVQKELGNTKQTQKVNHEKWSENTLYPEYIGEQVKIQMFGKSPLQNLD